MNTRLPAVLAAAFLVTFGACAQSADDVKTGLSKCAATADDHARLACYDQLAAGLKAPSGEAPAMAQTAPAQPVMQPAAPPAPVQTAAAPAKEQSGTSVFGFDLGSWINGVPQNKQTTPAQFGSDEVPATPKTAAADAEQPRTLDSIAAKVADFYYNPYGSFTVVLDSGQIWQQILGDTARARFHANDEITIERGMMGSYNLSIDDHNAIYKVRRLK